MANEGPAPTSLWRTATFQQIIGALKSPNPLSRLNSFIATRGIDWNSDSHSARKGYVMACLSEAAYFQLVEHELAEQNRYKLFEPSILRAALAERRLSIGLAELFPTVPEFAVEVILTDSYLYAIIDVWAAIVVAVRGTRPRSVSDWLINSRTSKRRTEGGSYHSGFYDEAHAVRPKLERAIGEKRPIYFTGHSMGAAVAVVLSQIWAKDDEVRIPYLFACPRFATRDTAASLPRYSYVRPFDIVPHLPPRILGFSDDGAITTVLPSSMKQERFASSLRYWVRRHSIEQHAMEEHRRLAGQIVGEAFAGTVYIDAIFTELNAAK
jgi:hypothetical protein